MLSGVLWHSSSSALRSIERALKGPNDGQFCSVLRAMVVVRAAVGTSFHLSIGFARPLLTGQDDESAEEVQRQLEREWGTVAVENEQADYEVDTAQLQAKVRSGCF